MLDAHRRGNWHDAVRERVDVIVRNCPTAWATPQSARRLGARTRLTLAVIHAVSCCRGFDVATNPKFWRRVVYMLGSFDNTDWEAEENDADDERLMEKLAPPLTGSVDAMDQYEQTLDPSSFSPTTFAHVGIEWFATETPNDAAFLSGFFHGTPACCSVLAAVVDWLRPYMNGSPQLLRASLASTFARDPAMPADDASSPSPYVAWVDPAVVPAALRKMLRAALATPADTETRWVTPMQFGLVVDYRVDYLESATWETIDLLARARSLSLPHLQLTIERLAIQLAPPTAPRHAEPGETNLRALVSRGRALGRFLWELLLRKDVPRIPTVAVLWCSLSDYRLVGAALSAVALMTPPTEELRCSGLFDSSHAQEKLLRLAWFAFALHCRGRRSQHSVPWSLSLLSHGVAMTDAESEYITQLLARGTPLRDVVGEALRLRCGGDDDRVASLTVECLRLGSWVRLARGTRLYFEPFRSDDACVAVALEGEEHKDEVEVVAHVADYGGSVGVVYGGYGLVWASVACVIAWECTDENVLVADMEETTLQVGLTSLTLLFENPAPLPRELKSSALRVAAMLPLLLPRAPRLQTLVLDRCVVTRDDLTLLLYCFPHLETLNLDRCVVESLAPLVDAFTERRLERLAALSLVGVRDLRFRARLVDRGVMLRSWITAEPKRGDAPVWLASFIVDALLSSGIAHDVLRKLYVDLRAMASEETRIPSMTMGTARRWPALYAPRATMACWRREWIGTAG
jgi:hypothetical protein